MAASTGDGQKMDRGTDGNGVELGAGEILRTAPRPSRLLLRAEDAAALCSMSVRTWRTWGTIGKIPRPIHIGRIPFWRYDELKAWVAAGCPNRATWDAMRE